jgi:hypothetical protein
MQNKYCSIIVKFCYQRLVNDAWVCKPHEHILPPANFSKKSEAFTMHKGGYRRPQLRVTRQVERGVKKKKQEQTASTTPDLRQQLRAKLAKRRAELSRKLAFSV